MDEITDGSIRINKAERIAYKNGKRIRASGAVHGE